MAVETQSHLQFGRAYSLKLSGSSDELELTGTVAWSALRRTAKNDDQEIVPVYRAGLEFEALSSEVSQRLWNLIQEHAVVNLEDSVLGRFQVELPSRSQLGASYDFSVRRLSLSGMLIETDFEPRLDSSFQLQLQLGPMAWRTRARVASLPHGEEPDEGRLVQVGLEFHPLGTRELGQLRTFLESRLSTEPDS